VALNALLMEKLNDILYEVGKASDMKLKNKQNATDGTLFQ
jgi:hypothetical protein